MNRRDFFPPADDPAPEPGTFSLLRVSRRAMATRFEVAIPLGVRNALAAAEDALDLIDDLEDQLTVYRDQSEVSRLNAAASAGPVGVEDGLFRLLEACAALTADTAGAFDVAAGALVKAWGFHRRDGAVPDPAARALAMRRTGFRHVVLNPADRSVWFRVPGLELNLGGVGKGYTLDRAAELLRNKWGVGAALLHGGGSSVFALGCPPDDPRGWPVAIRHPTDDRRTLGTVRLRDSALGTSAATFQFFEYNGRKLGHVLDPRTGWPASGTASASVVAPTAAEADAVSTAAFVLGPPAAADHLRSRPHLAAVLLADAADSPTVHNLPSAGYSPPTFRELYLNDLTFPD